MNLWNMNRQLTGEEVFSFREDQLMFDWPYRTLFEDMTETGDGDPNDGGGE